MTKDDKEIVSALGVSLAGKVGKERFDLWFGAATRLEYDGRAVRVGAPNHFFLDWIRANFRRHIEDACRDVFGRCPAVEFYLDAAAGTDDPMHLTLDGKRPATSASTSGDRIAAVTRKVPSSVAVATSPGSESPQPRRRFASLATFVAGETNRLAVTSAEMAVRRPGQLSPLMFYGPTSVGKTHLLEGIWTSLRQAHPRLTTLYLSAEQFTGQFLEALRGSGLPSFRRKYRGVGTLILDDLQFFVGKRATQIELLHTIDGFLREGRQLVFASDRSPAELAELGPELTTRLSSGLVCRIESPDYATRLGIVGQMARRMGLRVPADVQQMLASRLTRHAREISGALCRLEATGEASGRPISVAMAEESLADLFRNSGRMVRLSDIEKAVCEVLGLEPSSLQSDVKEKRVSHPRMLAMWLARKHTRAALSEIGHYFGRRRHSTVAAAQKRVNTWVSSGRAIELAEHRCPADEAIRRIESRLAAG